MPSLFIIDETDAHSSPASSSRRARTEWNLRKRFDYAGHRREMVQSFREADKFFKEHLQFQKQKRRESVVSARRISTAEEKQAEDEVLADVHQNAGSLVTPAGGGFGPGFNMTGLKKTLDEKREARERLVHRVHHLEGYAATPGIATVSDPETGRVKIVAQSKKEEEEMKQKGNTKPFVDKARLFPPLRTKTIPTNSSPLSASSTTTPRMTTTTVSTNTTKGEEKSLIHNHDEEDLGKLLNLVANTDNSSSGGEKSPNSGLLSVSQLSKKIMANQTTPTPLLMTQNQNQTQQQSTEDEVFRLPTIASASRRGTTTTTTVNNNNIPSPPQQQQQQAPAPPPSFNTMATATCQLPPSLSSPRSGLDTLFGNAKQNLKNAPIATASRTTNAASCVSNNSITQYLTSAQGSFIVGASGQVVTSGRSRGSSRTVSRGQSRRTSFIFSPNSAGFTTTTNNSNNNNTTTAIDLGNLTEDEFASLGLNSSVMSSPKFAGGGGGGNNSYNNIPPHYHQQQQQQQQQRQRGASHHRSAGAAGTLGGTTLLSGSGNNYSNNNNQKEGSLNTLDLGTTGTMRNTTQQQQRRHTQHNNGVLKIVIASNNTSV